MMDERAGLFIENLLEGGNADTSLPSLLGELRRRCATRSKSSARLGRADGRCQAPASTQNFDYRGEARRSEITVTNPSREGTVTRASLREYVAVQRERYQRLNPLPLQRELEAALERLWSLAAPDLQRMSTGTGVAHPVTSGNPD